MTGNRSRPAVPGRLFFCSRGPIAGKCRYFRAGPGGPGAGPSRGGARSQSQEYDPTQGKALSFPAKMFAAARLRGWVFDVTF
jgi:hypothetical protein